jgi:septum formation protein
MYIYNGLNLHINRQLIILASNSPRRVEILHRLNFDFIKKSPLFIEETFNKSDFLPELLPLVLAQKKALSISENYPDDLIIGCDTVVILDKSIFEKPSSLDDAISMCSKLSGKTHRVITGVSLNVHAKSIMCSFIDTTYVTFKVLSLNDIKQYLKLINPLDKAGGYAIQEHGDLIVDSIKGSYDNIVGFPTEKIIKSLQIINGLSV